MQRLHEMDLCGYLLSQEPDEWTVLSLPCIATDENGEEKALWEHKHTLDELKKIRENNPFVFETQYQQNPKPLEGLLLPIEELMFTNMNTIPEEHIVYRFAIVDPADKGGDKYSAPYLYVVQYDDVFRVYVKQVTHNKYGIIANTPSVLEKSRENKIEDIFVEVNGVGLSAYHDLSKENTTDTGIKSFTSR